jgi:phosphonate transport system ATP-binding protein
VDPSRARDVVNLLTNICEEEKLTLLMSIHNLELARAFFPRLVGLRGGAVYFDKATADITDTEFKALYDLNDDELLEGG